MSTENFDLILSKVMQYSRSLQLSCEWEYSIAKNAAEIVKVLGKHNIPS